MAMNRESLRHRPMGRVVCRLAWLTALGVVTGLSLPALASHRGSSGGSRGGSGFHASSGGGRSVGVAPHGTGYAPHRGAYARPGARMVGPRSFYGNGYRAYNRGYSYRNYGRGWGWSPSLASWWWLGGPWWGWGWGWGGGWGWWGGYPYGTMVYEGSGGYGYDRPRGAWGMVKTDIQPEEAEVWLDGHYIGTADDFDGNPDFLYLKPGKYALEFKLASYEPLSLDVEIAKGEQLRFDQALKLEPGKSALDSFTPPSKGMPSGRFFGPGGQAVSPSTRAENEEGRIGIDDRPGRTAVREERPIREERRAVTLAPRGDRGRLRFSVMPEDAAIYVDDRYVGVGEELNDSRRGVLVEAGKRTVTVSRPGYKTKTLEVEAKAGQPIDVVVDLEKGQ